MRIPLRHKLSVAAIVCCCLCAVRADGIAPERRALMLASFEEVWTTVRDRHYDPTLGGLDWPAVREEYLPRIEKAASEDEARATMNEMLGLLGQTHIGVIPALAYDDLEGGPEGDHAPGLDVRVLGDRAIVVRVEAGSPAAAAGAKPGWEILKVGEKPTRPMIERVSKFHSASRQKGLMGARAVNGLLSGPAGSTVTMEINDGATSRTLTLARREPRGGKVAFGNMPSARFWVETETLPGDIGLIRFNIWLNPVEVADAFSKIMEGAKSAKGFIVDLRGNPGGIGSMAMGAAGWFTRLTGQKLGVMTMRGATLNFVVSPRPNATDAPLAILVDECSASTTEIFAGGLQDLGRARIFGSRTAGAALPSAFSRLPNGDGFQYILANYVSEGGRPLEGLGVTPNETVEPTQKELLAGRDPALERAVAWINGVNAAIPTGSANQANPADPVNPVNQAAPADRLQPNP
jgi:carboxyl-terminal processing protease